MSVPPPTELLTPWPLDAGTILALGVAAAAYLLAVRRIRLGAGRGWPAARTAAFLAGLAALGLALGGGVDAYAERLLSVHMTQHLLLTLVAAPLLVLGGPVPLALRALPRSPRTTLARALGSRAVRVVGHPIVAVLLFAATVSAAHLPALYGFALVHPWAHTIEHALFFWTAMLLWWPVLGTGPAPHRPGWPMRLTCLLLSMPPMALVGAGLMSSPRVLYPAYLPSARALGVSALADQRTAAAIMWLGGGAIVTVVLLWLAARWMAEDERRARVRDARRHATTAGAVVCISGALAALIAPEPAAAQQEAGSTGRGRDLFVNGCSSCHGMDARGIPGRGPSLHGAGAAAADFYLTTGRMPLPAPGEQPMRTRPAYPPADVRALVAYVASLGPGPAIPAVDPARGDVGRGRELFTSHCAGCHQIAAAGGIVTGASVPDLREATPTQVGEAVRVGPYLMPHWSERGIDPAELDSLARFVAEAKQPRDEGGWGIDHIGPIPEGMVAWLLAGAALMLVIRLIGERTPE